MVRKRHGANKSFRQYKRTPTGRWDPAGVSKLRDKRPLFRLPEIKDKKIPVAVVEGEKDVNTILQNNSLAAVTCASGGAGSEKQTDWSPLAGKEVWLICDADQKGRDYMHRISQILLAHKCAVFIYDVHGRNDGSDLTDWVQEDGWDTVAERIKADKRPVEPRSPYIELGDVPEEDLGHRAYRACHGRGNAKPGGIFC